MGNMLPACLVHQGTTAALPAMKPRQRLISLRLLLKAIHKLKKMPRSNVKRAKIGSRSSSAAAAADGKGGGGGGELLEVMRKAGSNHPKGDVLRSRRPRGGGHKKGVVRVKVVLTKEEAARLLTLTAGGQRTAAQIVAEIKRMELRRAAGNAAWRPALESIPEETP